MAMENRRFELVAIGKKDVAAHFFLHMGLILAIFYPFKGLISLAIYVVFGEAGFATYINPAVAATLLIFVFLSFNSHARWSHFTKLDLYLGGIGMILLTYSLWRRNLAYSVVISLLLILPLCLGHLAWASDKIFKAAVTIFFFLTVFYVVIEHVVLHSHIYGLTDSIAFSYDDIAKYYSLLAFGQNVETIQATGNVIDFRHTSLYEMTGRLRTSGFLAHPLQMPTLISMSATFFYTSWRRSRYIWSLVVVGLCLFALGNSLSTTGVLAFALSVVFFEVFYGHGLKKWGIIGGALLVFAAATLYIAPLFYLFARLLGFWDDYLLKFGAFFSTWQDYAAVVWGKQGWLPGWNNLYNENDMVNIVTAFGILLAGFIFKRLVQPAFIARRLENDELIVYAMVVLNAFFCMLHREAVLSPNIFILVILLNVKSYRIIREYVTARI